MRALFVHQNFPGQYVHLAPAMAAQGHAVHALSMRQNGPLPGVTQHVYRTTRGTSQGIHPWVSETETKVLRGDACARAALTLKEKGFTPDLICVHPGWGEALFLRDVWPKASQLHYVEFFYGAEGRDVGFDPEFAPPDFDECCRIRMKNANSLLNLEAMDAGVSPTRWQWSTVPEPYRDRISVMHDGIDTQRVRPDAQAVFGWKTPQGKELTVRAGDPVVTFVNRNLEPSRGYHALMRALPRMMAQNPSMQMLIVGGDDVSYGARPAVGSYKAQFLAEVSDRIDPARLHFLGRLPYADYLRLLQVSAAHIYLTYPFVLSWSMLEAMSAGALVIGSRTAPVEEVILDRENGWLVDFFSPEELADRVSEALNPHTRAQQVRDAARQTMVERYDLRTHCLPRLLDLAHRTAGA